MENNFQCQTLEIIETNKENRFILYKSEREFQKLYLPYIIYL